MESNRGAKAEAIATRVIQRLLSGLHYYATSESENVDECLIVPESLYVQCVHKIFFWSTRSPVEVFASRPLLMHELIHVRRHVLDVGKVRSHKLLLVEAAFGRSRATYLQVQAIAEANFRKLLQLGVDPWLSRDNSGAFLTTYEHLPHSCPYPDLQLAVFQEVCFHDSHPGHLDFLKSIEEYSGEVHAFHSLLRGRFAEAFVQWTAWTPMRRVWIAVVVRVACQSFSLACPPLIQEYV
jgi:hypothetical protein